MSATHLQAKNQYFKVLIVLLSQLHINKPETNKLLTSYIETKNT